MQANKKTGAGRVLLFFSTLALGTLIFIYQTDRRQGSDFNWGKPDPLTQTIELIRTRYVDDVPMDSLRGLDLDNLMSRLDPHSVYLDPASLRMADEELAGHFAGIGIEFSRIKDTVMVIQVIPESPSLQAGLQIGDQLIAIDSISLTDRSLSLDSIRLLVRGPIGSIANLTVFNAGKTRRVSIERSEISTPAVAASLMLDDTTGFIKLTRFSNKSYRETMIALEALQKKGMRALVLDLRGNGGGFLLEAVELADEFLSDDRLIVYTEGAHQKKRTYSCKRPGLFESGTLTILMDEFSASASEVLAGALQDWCRAKIVGRRSFGKGLVQEQYALSNQGAIRLTVARYYTPLGRCIQRPYKGDRTGYLHDLLNEGREVSTSNQPGKRIYFNPCGDSLFAAGGIQPDRSVQSDTLTISSVGKKILQNPELIQIAFQLSRDFKESIGATAHTIDWNQLIPLDWIKRLTTIRVGLKEKELQTLSPTDWTAIQRDLYAQIIRLSWGPTEFYRYLLKDDPYLRVTK